MKLTLVRDNGEQFSIVTDKEPEGPLVTHMQQMCVMLDDWAKARDATPVESDKDNGC
jgi:hypothetical protein